MMRILVIEDDRSLAAIVQQGLEESGYQVEIATDGVAGLERASSGDFDLILLDLMLPRMDGWTVCREFRAFENQSQRERSTPILMLTARDAVDDRVQGLEIGADDYLTKPFAFKELRARVQALLRRENAHRARLLRVGDLEINTVTQEARRAECEVRLTPREYALLELLARHAGHAVSREMILGSVWQGGDVASNTIDVYINFLRHKIDDGHSVKLIHTEHRRGYSLRAPDEVRSAL